MNPFILWASVFQMVSLCGSAEGQLHCDSGGVVYVGYYFHSGTTMPDPRSSSHLGFRRNTCAWHACLFQCQFSSPFSWGRAYNWSGIYTDSDPLGVFSQITLKSSFFILPLVITPICIYFLSKKLWNFKQFLCSSN